MNDLLLQERCLAFNQGHNQNPQRMRSNADRILRSKKIKNEIPFAHAH
jgi:hypothetical protein